MVNKYGVFFEKLCCGYIVVLWWVQDRNAGFHDFLLDLTNCVLCLSG